MNGIKPELIEKASRLTDWSQHEYRVDSRTWIPRCVCGWTATESYDVEGFDRHITETVLATVADDLRAEAWDEGFAAGANADLGDWEHPPEEYTNPYRQEARDE